MAGRLRWDLGACRHLRRIVLLLAVLLSFDAAHGAPRPGRVARRILTAAGVKGGLVVHLGCGDGRLTAALRAGDGYVVHGLEEDPSLVEAARSHIRSLGLYGPVSVRQWSGDSLPYADDLVNLVVCDEADAVPMDELMRVLTPRGVACVRTDGEWVKTVKPWPREIDEWTHYLHGPDNNAVARDARVGPPRHLRWVGRPFYSRSHEIDTSVCALVSAAGRIFYILDEGLTGITDPRLPAQWSLVARDAFNGVLLWKRPLDRWGWKEWKPGWGDQDWTKTRAQRVTSPVVLPRRLVARGDRVYATLSYEAPLSVLDAATGETVRVCEGTECADEIVCVDGVVVLCVRPAPATGSGSRDGAEGAPESVMAVRPGTGETLWTHREEKTVPLSLAASDGRVYFHNYREVVCLDLASGEEVWRTPCEGGRGGTWDANETLIVHDDVVVFVGPRGTRAFAAGTGSPLWKGPGGRGTGVRNPPDAFLAGGLLWYGRHRTGRNPLTGRVERELDLQKVISPGHHFRCYRGKATDRFLLWPKRGVEFLDLEDGRHMRHDWLRAPCRLGVMPSNGLLYVPPHQCFCYPGVKLDGFNALAHDTGPKGAAAGGRLVKGPAFGEFPAGRASVGDWPTFRHDLERSGHMESAVSADLERRWVAEPGGRLSQPVVADGRLFVASIDSHTVHCLDAASGGELWRLVAGGRVDSPPTYHRGLLLFGAADGWVYCLRAADGELAWRFRAAPAERLVGAFGQLESAWPVHGSVLMLDGVAYVAAGRSSYLDGGIYLYGLDPRTGEKLYQTCLEGPRPDIEQDEGRPFDMEGTKSDVLVSDGTHLYMFQSMLDAKLRRQETPRITRLGDREFGRHLFSTAGLLRGAHWNRTFWMYSGRWPGFYIANKAPKTGQMLCFDDATTFGVKMFNVRNVHSPMFFPGRTPVTLFADDNDNEPILTDRARDRDKGVGFSREKPPGWSVEIPVIPRAMVLAADRLFVCGPPNLLDPEDPLGAFEGRKGARLLVVDVADGSTLAGHELDSPPAFDGMIAAGGRLYVSTEDGRLICME